MAFAVLDVDYEAGTDAATAACVVADRDADATPFATLVARIDHVAPYVPGRFAERELPCLLAVLAKLRDPVDTLVIDGYVQLDAAGTPGLGAHLYDHFAGRYAVIGVAKTPYGDGGFAIPVYRGGSRQPLWVTAAGVPPEQAAARVQAMHGAHRIPTLLTWVDRLAAGDPPPWPIGRGGPC
ncbi:MAG: endonuclease V [Nannocystaceae bacterium]|nr:endonuclease V [Nannocystaceae bacterium]